MHGSNPKHISNFHIAGINYRKSDAAIRGQFAISNDQYAVLLEHAPAYGVQEFFVVSTCNRTEIYGFAADPAQLISLLCSQTEGKAEVFAELAYIKQGFDAVEHFFHVGAGLDSQILGDYEIVGQIKLAAKMAKTFDRVDAFTERLVNCMLQASKAIKN
ncbi:MAG TPA: glutamyl-tRNA reductase, partial [Chitinophagaceae bacterium]|nr:glutamyl-tRNA reductase [Chitinophagaceae bacterium]